MDDIAVKTGSYEKDGKTKNRYENVGYVLTAEDGGKMYFLNRTFNPAGMEVGKALHNVKRLFSGIVVDVRR